MRMGVVCNFGVGMLIFVACGVHAQSSRTDELAKQWRASRLADLEAERARLSTERMRVDAAIDALPSAPPAAPTTQALSVSGPSAASQDNASTPTDLAGKNGPVTSDTRNSGSNETPGRQKFGGLDLGVGLSFTADVGKEDRISRASVVNGIVRTDDQDNGRARIMLETHYFFTPCTWDFLKILRNPCNVEKDSRGREFLVADREKSRWGLGPFVAVQPGSDNIIDAIALGIMVGARRERSNESFNFGVGVVLDPNTRLLGEGIEANKPLPIGETEIRYRETLQTGVLVLTSFSF